jgi:hypothetical protein
VGLQKLHHSGGATITSTTSFIGWGEAASGDLVLEPGMWSLDNFGDKAICLIHDSAVFEWDSAATNATNNKSYNYNWCTNCIKTYVSIYTG